MTQTAHDNTDIAALLPALRTLAARLSRVPDEGEDLLHDALLEAVRVGRTDLSQAVNYRWLVGTMRNLSAMTARSAVRRRVRETRWADEDVPRSSAPLERDASPRAWRTHPLVQALPPSLRAVALLALSGHDRREIAWLLKLSDTAMRQRIAALRKRLGSMEFPAESTQGSSDALPLGLIRRALLPVVVATESLGAHDPDGHLLAIAAAGAHVFPLGGNKRVHAVTSPRSSQESVP